MKIVIQRVKSCNLSVDGTLYSAIERGMLIFLGVNENDSENDAEKLAAKIVGLRIFSDENGKINLCVSDPSINGEIMIVSNFTLYGDCRKGRRPDFFKAAKADKANELYEYFVKLVQKEVAIVKTGIFGADMEIDIRADGPITLIIESAELA